MIYVQDFAHRNEIKQASEKSVINLQSWEICQADQSQPRKVEFGRHFYPYSEVRILLDSALDQIIHLFVTENEWKQCGKGCGCLNGQENNFAHHIRAAESEDFFRMIECHAPMYSDGDLLKDCILIQLMFTCAGGLLIFILFLSVRKQRSAVRWKMDRCVQR